MVSYYSVVQYVPDPVTDERINIGVIVVGDGRPRTRFLQDWRRVRQFGQQDPGALREFAREINQAANVQLPLDARFDVLQVNEQLLQRMTGRWINSIQVTPPRASLLSPSQLLDEMAARFLREPLRAHRQGRDRRTAIKLAEQQIEAAVVQRVGPINAEHYVRRNLPVEGKLDNHQLDIAVANGHLYFGAQALSFERPDSEDLARDVRVTAWLVTDMKNQDAATPLAVVALSPKQPSMQYEEARHIFEGLNTPILTETEVGYWAVQMAARLPAQT
jgi:hypothetical protein